MTVPGARIAVVGAGTTSLVQRLAGEGFAVTAIDVSQAAIDQLREELEGEHAPELIVADVRELRLDPPVDTWHDRAVFHFLVEAADRDAYVAAARASIRVGGHAVIAAFAPDGPDRCSGLPVQRHDAASLGAAFGRDFEVTESFESDHVTPWGAAQRFTHAVLRRTS